MLHVDRFGNLVTTVREAQVAALGAGPTVHIAGRRLPLVSTYGDLRRGQAGAVIGSGGRLEVAVREGSAAVRLRARRGTPVVVSPKRSAARSRRPWA